MQTSSTKTLVFDKCVLLSVNLAKFSIHRKADKAKMQTQAEKEMVTFGKKLLDSPELKAIEQLDHKIYNYLKWDQGMRSLPFDFKDGIYLIPLALLVEVEFKLLTYQEERNKLIDIFLKVYEQQKAEAEKKLADQYKEKDYPSVEQVARRFHMSWEKFILSVPESIKQVSPSLYEEEKQRIANQLKEAQKEIFGLMRQEALTYMQKLIGRLTPKKDGSYPSLKEDLFERIKDFLEVFQSRNICNDQQLGVAVEMARQALQGVQVTDLENNDSLREEIRREFEKASSEVFTSISVKQTQPIPINNQVSPISETQIAEQVQAAMDVSAKVANQKMDWADDLFSFCEAAA